MTSEYLITFYAVPVFLLLVLIEYLYLRKRIKNAYSLNDTITNLNIGAGHLLTKSFSGIIILAVYEYLYKNVGLLEIKPSWYALVFALIAYDFFFYWAHRWGHTVNIFWGAHLVHHQSEYYNLSVALRQSWIHTLLAMFVFLPIPMLGIPIEVFGIAASINTFYQFWIHTEAIHKLPKWVEYIFNTPTHHRVHHGINPMYIDKNHAGMFIIWDRMFGTFQEERESPVYGITTPLNSWNPFWSNVHYYVEMVKKMATFKKLNDRLIYLFAKPSWQPNYLGGEQKLPEVHRNTFVKYNQQASMPLNLYVLIQFLLIIIGMMAYMYNYENIPLWFRNYSFGLLMISTLACGAIFEQKRWGVFVEYTRWLLAFVGFNLFIYLYYYDKIMLSMIFSIIITVLCLAFFTTKRNVFINN